MIVNYQTDDTGRLQSVTSFPLDESAPTIDLPDDFDLGSASDYRLQAGELIHDPLPEPEPTAQARIAALKSQLADTDYIVIKIVEGAATWDDYSGMREQREAWREEIRSLENTEAANE